jgi:hypothetical protein
MDAWRPERGVFLFALPYLPAQRVQTPVHAGIPSAPASSIACPRRPAASEKAHGTQGEPMLWTIFVILLVLWLLGLVTSYTLGGFIHILLVVAIAVLLIQLISGRRAV